MIYKLRDIIRDVRITLDENRRSEPLITEGDIDTLSLDELIASKVIEGVRNIVTTASVEDLDGGNPFGDSVSWQRQRGGNYMGRILLPDDFLRLVIFKMSDWERAVYIPVLSGDAQYMRQFSRYKGLRGNGQKPVVAIVKRSEGLILEFFSSKDTDATVEQAEYYGLPRIDRDGGVKIPRRCYTSAINEIGGLVAGSLNIIRNA